MDDYLIHKLRHALNVAKIARRELQQRACLHDPEDARELRDARQREIEIEQQLRHALTKQSHAA